MTFPYSCITRRYAAGISALLFTVPLTMTAAAVHAATDQTETSKTSLTFRDNVVHQRVVEKRGDVAIVEDDMIVGHASDYFGANRTVRGLGNTIYGRTWPNGVVPYQMSNDLTQANRAKVAAAIEHWNANSTILLVERNDDNSTDYPHYLYFINAAQCASWVGFQGTGSQDVYVGDTCTTGSMIHEIGHGLGLLHEHTRPDRDAFVTIHWGNVIAGKEHNFDVLSDGAVPLGDYDYGSIMHYGTHFFSNNNAATISANFPTSATIGQRTSTSAGDREAIATLYEAELSLTADSSQSQLTANEPIELNLTITNNSGNGANTLAVTLPATPGMGLVQADSVDWNCSQATTGAQIDCALDVMQAGDSSNLSITVSTDGEAGEKTLVPQLSSRTQDSDTDNNAESVTVTILNADGTTDSGSSVQPQTPDEPDGNTGPDNTFVDNGTDTAGLGQTEVAENNSGGSQSSTDTESAEVVQVVATGNSPAPVPQIAAANAEASGGAAGMGSSLLALIALTAMRRRQFMK